MDTLTKLDNITRVEVIDETGRAYTKWGCKNVYQSIQDNDKTLKIFIGNKIGDLCPSCGYFNPWGTDECAGCGRTLEA